MYYFSNLTIKYSAAAIEKALQDKIKAAYIPTDKEKLWSPSIYEGGKPIRFGETVEFHESAREWINYHDEATESRALVVSVVTASSTNSTAIDVVNKVYNYIKNGNESLLS